MSVLANAMDCALKEKCTLRIRSDFKGSLHLINLL